ncbi:MAG: hypothetical protein Q9194_006650 [Teloschistes cf. exilis]
MDTYTNISTFPLSPHPRNIFKINIPAMPFSELHPIPDIVTHKLRPHNILRSNTFLNPPHHCRQYIMRGIEANPLGCGSAPLPEHPRPRTGLTMEHAWNAEEAEERIQVLRGGFHALKKVLIEALGVETSDFLVLEAVVGYHFPSPDFEGGKGAWPSTNICGVAVVSDGGVVKVEGGCIP